MIHIRIIFLNSSIFFFINYIQYLKSEIFFELFHCNQAHDFHEHFDRYYNKIVKYFLSDCKLISKNIFYFTIIISYLHFNHLFTCPFTHQSWLWFKMTQIITA